MLVQEITEQRCSFGGGDGKAINRHSIRVFTCNERTFTLDKNLSGCPAFYELGENPSTGFGFQKTVNVPIQSGISWSKASEIARKAIVQHCKETPPHQGWTTNTATYNRIDAMQTVVISGYWKEDGKNGDSFENSLCKIGSFPDDASDEEYLSDESVFYYFETKEELSRGNNLDLVITSYTIEETSLDKLATLWQQLGNIPTVGQGDNVDTIEQVFLYFPIGTHREEIWRWFEDQNSQFLVGEVLKNGTMPIRSGVGLTKEQILKDNPDLLSYRVMLHEDKGDKFKIAFDCYAQCDDHAEEQALNAYPNGEIVTITSNMGNDDVIT